MLTAYSPLNRKNFHIYGRIPDQEQDALPLLWTGSGVEFLTDSSEVWLDLESDYAIREEWIRMEVDGVCMQRCIVPKGRSTVCVFRGFSMGQFHSIRILKESQPWQEDENRFFLMHSVLCDGTVCEAVRKKYRLEFVGDSLSSGEGLSGPTGLVSPCSGVFGLDGHYAVRTADALQADFRILAQSGWGVCCGWNNNPEYTMPRYYEQVCGIAKGMRNRELGVLEHNNFGAWKPDAVVVNLGSNDGFALNEPAWVDPVDKKVWKQCLAADGRMDKDSVERFEHAAVSFLKQLRRDNSDAWLIWAYGMIDHMMQPYLEESMRQYLKESGDEKAEFLCLPAGCAAWLGSNNHPGRKAHKAASEVLIKELEKRLQETSQAEQF